MHAFTKPNAWFNRRAGVPAEWRIFRPKSFPWQPLGTVPAHRSGRFFRAISICLPIPLVLLPTLRRLARA
ncbi:MAG: hypothetical protein ACREP2_12955, partial [Rhodanobacteraceae bacterium]